MDNEESLWICFLLKDRYSTDFEKKDISKVLCENNIVQIEDIRYFSKDDCNAMSFYFFVRNVNSEMIRKIFECCGGCFDSAFRNVMVTDSELNEMYENVKSSLIADVKYGDILKIRKGKYEKLWGIALRESNDGTEVDVGFKFCFGKVVKRMNKSDFVVEGNIFNYLKILN